VATPNYTVPDNPADPEAAALELIVCMPTSAPTRLTEAAEAAGLAEVLQDYTGMLHAEGAFAGLSWADAKPVAAAICFDICLRENAVDFMRWRAGKILGGGTDNMPWCSREGAARALNIAATVLGLCTVSDANSRGEALRKRAKARGLRLVRRGAVFALYRGETVLHRGDVDEVAAYLRARITRASVPARARNLRRSRRSSGRR
jgi:hypothetical protein